MQGKKNFSDQRLASFRLSERVPRDNFYRRLKDLLDLAWLYEATKKYYGSEGHKSIDPVVFFKLILVGYLENLLSDRRIIQTVSLRLDLLLFIGCELNEPLPWHSTLSRTRQRLGEEVFKEKSVQQHHHWKDKAYKGRPGSGDQRSKFVSNHTHYSTTDPDARVAVKPGKPRQLNYLG